MAEPRKSIPSGLKSQGKPTGGKSVNPNFIKTNEQQRADKILDKVLGRTQKKPANFGV